jgi:formylglycine-generating enzyme required for sulfatase activity
MKKQILIAFLALSSLTSITAQSTPQLVTVQGGTFTMGDDQGVGQDNEQPTHEVTLSTYQISKTEVTVAQYRRYCNARGVSMPEEPSWGWQSSHPIVNVSWNDAINYCDWLSEELDQNINLPTEAQWEFAARGGTKSKGYKYAGGRSIASVGWFIDSSGGKTHEVASKKANELGLYDMSGNVGEWCLDWYDGDYYGNSPAKNPKNTSKGKRTYRVRRGGSWNNSATYCRVSNRSGDEPTSGDCHIGFRVVSF